MQTHLVRVAVFASLGLAAACANPSEGKSKAEVSAPAPALAKVTPTPGQAEPETVPIAAGESKIAWVGAKVTKRHDGGFNKWDGKVELAGELEQSRLSFTIDMASVFTDSEKLAGHLRSPDFFGTPSTCYQIGSASCKPPSSAGQRAMPAASCPLTPTCNGPNRCWPPTTGWPTAKNWSATASDWPIAAAA